MAKTTYPISVIAKLLDLTERRVYQLARAGVIPRTEKGRYDLVPAVQGYIRYLRNLSQGGEGNTSEEIARDKARLIKAQADAVEMDNALRRGELLPREIVRKAWERAVVSCRARFLVFFDKVPPQVVGCSSIPEIKELMQREGYEVLEELAGTDYSGCVALDSGDPLPGDGALPAAAEACGEPVGG